MLNLHLVEDKIMHTDIVLGIMAIVAGAILHKHLRDQTPSPKWLRIAPTIAIILGAFIVSICLLRLR